MVQGGRIGYAAPSGARASEARTARRRLEQGLSVDWLVIGLAGASVLVLGTVSPELLTALKIHYILPGGAFYEKLHPAAYLAALAFLLLLLRGGDVIGEFDRVISGSKLLLVYFFTCALLALQCVVLKRPFTAVIDTFLLPALLTMVLWRLSPAQRKPLVACVHAVIWLNIVLGLYEYLFKHRLIALTVGNVVVTGDWRSTALLGHPLAAAGTVAIYIMAVVLSPRLRPPSVLGIAALMVASSSLMAFGGRTALVAVLVVLAALAIRQFSRLVRGERVGLTSVILAAGSAAVICAALAVLFGSGAFDNMLTRFSSDNGSAHARIASLHLVTLFDWKELLFGTSPAHAGSLQSMMGLDFGIENFWIACIVQYGAIQTALITLGLGCFFAEVLRRSSKGAWVLVLFIAVVAASSVSFSSKNVTLATYVTIITLLLPREAERPSARAPLYARRRVASPALAPSQ